MNKLSEKERADLMAELMAMQKAAAKK